MNARDAVYRNDVVGLAREIDGLDHAPEHEEDFEADLPASLSRAAGNAILATVNQRPVIERVAATTQRRPSITTSGVRRVQPKALNSSTISRSRASSMASNSADEASPMSASRRAGRGLAESYNSKSGDELLSDSSASKRRRGTIGALFG